MVTVARLPHRSSPLRSKPLHRAAAALLSLTLAVSGLLAAAPIAAAEEAAPITWAVSPADANGPNKRSWVELELDPGASASDFLAVRNLSTQSVTFRLDTADGYFTKTGRFNMLPSDKESTDAGTWIALADDSVTLDGGATAVVPFTVTVPENVEPGDHAAGIAASLISSGSDEEGASVGVESRVGFRVMTRVTGELAPSLTMENLHADYDMSWNPFRPGSVTLRGEAVNGGNTRVLVDGTASAGGDDVAITAADRTAQELLPGDRRTIEVTIDDVWPLFFVTAGFDIEPTMVTLDGTTDALPTVTAEAGVLAIPWSQLLVLLGVALIVLALLGGRIRNRRKVEALVQAAREEGRAEAVKVD